MHRIKETIVSQGFPCLRSCRVEVSGQDGMVRVFQQKGGPSSVTTTPSSVLETAQALAAGSDLPAGSV